MKLKEKSKFNYDASEILIDSHLFAPSVHCSYYAAFQLMKVAMQAFCGISYKEIDNYVAANKGLDIDKPRNLAKSVTVE